MANRVTSSITNNELPVQGGYEKIFYTYIYIYITTAVLIHQYSRYVCICYGPEMALFVTGGSVTGPRDEVLSCGAIQFNPDAGVNIIQTRRSNKGDC